MTDIETHGFKATRAIIKDYATASLEVRLFEASYIHDPDAATLADITAPEITGGTYAPTALTGVAWDDTRDRPALIADDVTVTGIAATVGAYVVAKAGTGDLIQDCTFPAIDLSLGGELPIQFENGAIADSADDDSDLVALDARVSALEAATDTPDSIDIDTGTTGSLPKTRLRTTYTATLRGQWNPPELEGNYPALMLGVAVFSDITPAIPGPILGVLSVNLPDAALGGVPTWADTPPSWLLADTEAGAGFAGLLIPLSFSPVVGGPIWARGTYTDAAGDLAELFVYVPDMPADDTADITFYVLIEGDVITFDVPAPAATGTTGAPVTHDHALHFRTAADRVGFVPATGHGFAGTVHDVSAALADLDGRSGGSSSPQATVIVPPVGRTAGSGTQVMAELVPMSGGGGPLAIDAGNQLLALTRHAGQTLAQLGVIVTATDLADGEQVEVSCYHAQADGTPGTRAWTQLITVGTTTGAIIVTGLALAMPTGECFLAVANLSGNSGAVSLSAGTAPLAGRWAAMDNPNLTAPLVVTSVSSASADMSAFQIRSSSAGSSSIGVDASTTFPVIGGLTA